MVSVNILSAQEQQQLEQALNELLIEVRSNPQAFLTALSACEQIKNNDEVTLIGSEYTLFINTDEVMIRANNLAIETDEILEDNFHYYDEESIAFCGTTDFIHFLNAYFEFIA